MKVVTLLVLALLAASFTACGDDDTSSETGDQATRKSSVKVESEEYDLTKKHPGQAVFGSPPLEFEADPGGDLAYTTDTAKAKEGNVTIEFTNPQSVPHDVTVEASGGGKVETDTIENSFDAVTITLNTKEKFIFYCSVPGHREAGMEGTIVVGKRN